jgi:hypothetical protein
MFTTKQYRAKAAEYAEFVNVPRSLSETGEFRDLQRAYTALGETEEWPAGNIYNKRLPQRKNRKDRIDLSEEEEEILRCLGAAVIMQWNTLPRKLKRELFDRAGSIGEPRRQKLMADALDDVWRFSCEMPDAPHLSKN